MNFVLGHIQGHDRGQGLDRGRAIVNVLPAEADRGAEAGTTSDEIGRRRTRVDRRRAGTVPRRAEETAVPSGETDHVPPSKTTALSAGACLEGKVVAAVESRVEVVMELPSERETLLARSLALTETRLQRRCRFLLKKNGDFIPRAKGARERCLQPSAIFITLFWFDSDIRCWWMLVISWTVHFKFRGSDHWLEYCRSVCLLLRKGAVVPFKNLGGHYIHSRGVHWSVKVGMLDCQ